MRAIVALMGTVFIFVLACRRGDRDD
jgi:hypothetical protein